LTKSASARNGPGHGNHIRIASASTWFSDLQAVLITVVVDQRIRPALELGSQPCKGARGTLVAMVRNPRFMPAMPVVDDWSHGCSMGLGQP